MNEINIKQLSTVLFLSIGLWMFSACDILEVENPNNLIEDELSDPASAVAIVNGSEAAVTRALGAIYAPYSTASDELTWIGSRDGWERLNLGDVEDRSNEFTDNAFRYVGEGRWTADEAIKRIEGFREEGTLQNVNNLARAYLYGAIMYITITDMFEDYALSDRQEAAPPVGPSNMPQLYDTAIEYIDSGLTYAEQAGNEDLTSFFQALRARTNFSIAARSKIKPSVDTDNPLVSSAAADADAEAALQQMNGSDTWHRMIQNSDTPGIPVGDMSLALQVNVRLEMRISDEYIVAEDSRPAGIVLEDPIDEIPDPILTQLVNEFTEQERYADINIVSAREMHLILAESALANNDMVGFTEHINAIREFDGLTEYTGQMDARELLEHTRRVNLFLQGRRVLDHYRFDNPSAYWSTSSAAFTSPGALFPITITEVRANPHID